MKIDDWFQMVEKKSQKDKEGVQWFVNRVRIRHIQDNNLLSRISTSRSMNTFH